MSSTDYSSGFRDFLSKSKALASGSLERAFSICQSENVRLDRAILSMGLLEEGQLLPLLAEFLELEFRQTVAPEELDNKVIQELGVGYFKENGLAPLHTKSGQALILVSDPGNKVLLREAAFFLDTPIIPIVATSRCIAQALSISQSDNNTEAEIPAPSNNTLDVERFRDTDIDGPTVRILDRAFADAVDLGASDIHFESTEQGLRIRVRIHGVLTPYTLQQDTDIQQLLARVKVLAGLNVSERQLPQDGRILKAIAGRKIEFRVSSIPTQFGESIVCRILDPKALRLGWQQLGFDADITASIIDVIERPNGLFLVTGPTGSGKTTTLYTALSHLNDGRKKIITVEDPIEYTLEGIDQMQVRSDVGLTFSRALRSVLRQDPDVIMVGEIRDQETAEIACRAALVGRMVIATLHTNSAEGAVMRMLDLGVPKYVLDDVLRAALGQRLVVVGCERCGGKGCENCNEAGFVGRRLEVELFQPKDQNSHQNIRP